MNTNPVEAVQTLSKCLVFICFVFSIFRLNKDKTEHVLLFGILCVSAFYELATAIGLLNSQAHPWVSTLALAIHQLLWLALICLFLPNTLKAWGLAAFLGFAILDFAFFEGTSRVNCFTLVVSSIAYILIFCVFCFAWLKEENIKVFASDRFLLLSAPLLFFFGMSAILSFRSRELSNAPFGYFNLYNIVNFSGNIMYYSLLFAYLLRQKPHRHE